MRVIEYKTISCGPSGQYQPGEPRYNVPDDEARALIAGGYAIDITPRATLTMPVREQTVVAPVERAVGFGQPTIPPRKRGR